MPPLADLGGELAGESSDLLLLRQFLFTNLANSLINFAIYGVEPILSHTASRMLLCCDYPIRTALHVLLIFYLLA